MTENMTNTPLKIFFVPMEFVGHTTAMVGLAQKMVSRGHNVTFAVDESRVQLVTRRGVNVEIVDNGYLKGLTASQYESIRFYNWNKLWERSENRTALGWLWDVVKHTAGNVFIFYNIYKRMVVKNEQLRRLIDLYEPDVFVVDDFVGYQAILESNRPWVWYFSANPLLLLDDDSLPPPFSGLSPGEANVNWHLSRIFNNLFLFLPQNIANLAAKALGSPLRLQLKRSPYLNIYGLPKELDYKSGKGVTNNNIFRVDSFITREDVESVGAFDLSEKLHKFGYKPNEKKVIYVSMGSFCSANIQYMKRLIAVLAKSPHIFIVSKGYYHKEYELADNMWGESFLPQKQIMEVVDLVITHGGNNTVTEALTLGKPMIVIPFYMDQFDNAQRVQDCRYGIRMNSWKLDEDLILTAIEQLLNDYELKRRLIYISKRIANEDRLTQAAKLVEKLNQNYEEYLKQRKRVVNIL